MGGDQGLYAVLTAQGIQDRKIEHLESETEALISHIQKTINSNYEDKEPFYILDISKVVELFTKWKQELGIVKPFYAVKCNPEPALLGAMAALGSCFDCASKAEIEAVLAVGVAPDRIVYANPCKAESHIKYAATVGVNLTTFDSVEEIKKLQKWHPKCKVLLRIQTSDDGEARCPLGSKYGAFPEEVVPLLLAAKEAEITVSGISFHIGSGAEKSEVFSGAIAAAKDAFDTANQLNMPNMTILDIGGGFTSGSMFEEASEVIKSALEKYFNKVPHLQVISEPGRYFAETPFTLATNIIGKRVREKLREYFINDGLYGSMNCILYDHATVTALPLACLSDCRNPMCKGKIQYQSIVYGPTCDALDTILKGYELPELYVGDWLIFPNMGAYTAAAGSSFNGFDTSSISTYLVFSRSNET